MTSLTLDRALDSEPTKCEEKEAMKINTENSRLLRVQADLVGVSWIGTTIFISTYLTLRSHESGTYRLRQISNFGLIVLQVLLWSGYVLSTVK